MFLCCPCWFGVPPNSVDNNGELGAFDLVTNTLLWRRTVREAQGTTHTAAAAAAAPL
jgi:hypothetical protein